MTLRSPGATWLAGMQAHFGRTGEYRSVDVLRLLGDQSVAFNLCESPRRVVLCHDGTGDGPKK